MSAKLDSLTALSKRLTDAGLLNRGVSTPRFDDKATWLVDWVNPPTAQQEAQAQTIIAAFDVAAEIAKATEDAGTARGEIMARGIVNLLVAKGVCTLAEAKAAIKAAWQASQ